MDEIIINLYWKDLSLEGQETLLNANFAPTPIQLLEEEPIGTIITNREDWEIEFKINS